MAEGDREKCQEVLGIEWGIDREWRTKRAQRMIREIGDVRIFQWLNESGIGNDPRFLIMLDNFAEKWFGLMHMAKQEKTNG
ncbi:MAG: hypothetical protein ABIH23_26175 [bacterium]